MKKWIAPVLLILYTAILIKVIVFKDIPTIRIGHLMLRFGGTESGHSPNFVPFSTIVPYLFGFQGLIIAGINIVGNIALLVPVGLLLALAYPGITWKKTVIVAIASGLVLEFLQAILQIGIFDIDDVILNALGVLIGYGLHQLYKKTVAILLPNYL